VTPDRKPGRPRPPPPAARAERFFATGPRGLESALATELRALGATEVEATDGGVSFAGALALAYRVNLWSRLASRILWQVGFCRYREQQDIFDHALKLPWQRWFAVDDTIRVNVTAIRSPLASIDFVTLRIKDAVCDRFRLETGRRPSIDTAAPGVRIHAFLTRDTCTFYVDTSGEALFKRGYRRDALAAPLRENLAAGMLALSGWTPAQPLLDPFCGSGTIAIEAALIAAAIPPGALRRFGFERLAWFDAKAWQRERDAAIGAADGRPDPSGVRIVASDIAADAIAAARTNAAAAGVEAMVELAVGDARDVAPPAGTGFILANPPYGVRLSGEDDLREVYAAFADNLKRRFTGWEAWLLIVDPALVKAIRLAPSRRIPLFNGALECRLLQYRMVAGSNRRIAPGPGPEGG